MSYASDLRAGRWAEEYVRDLFRAYGFPALLNESKDRGELVGWDVEITLSKPLRSEVKWDRLQAKTKRLAVEYKNSNTGVPSGIAATKSGLWTFVLGTQEEPAVWGCPVPLLKGLFHQLPHRDIHHAGDGNASIRLFEDHLLLPRFTRLDGLVCAKVRRFLEGCLAS